MRFLHRPYVRKAERVKLWLPSIYFYYSTKSCKMQQIFKNQNPRTVRKYGGLIFGRTLKNHAELFYYMKQIKSIKKKRYFF